MEKIMAEIKQLGNMSNEKKALVIIFFFILFIVSLRLGRALTTDNKQLTTNNKQPTTNNKQLTTNDKQKPTQNQVLPTQGTLSTTLTLSPSALNLKVGEETTASLILSELPVTVLTVSLKYDPDTLEVSDLQNGPIFKRMILNKIENGTIYYTSAVNLDEVGKLQEGTAFTFKVKALKDTESTGIEFVRAETLAALDGANRLGETIDTTVLITK